MKEKRPRKQGQSHRTCLPTVETQMENNQNSFKQTEIKKYTIKIRIYIAILSKLALFINQDFVTPVH